MSTLSFFLYRGVKKMSLTTNNMYFIVSIISKDQEKVYGQLNSPVLEHSVDFSDLAELILLMNQIISECHVFFQDMSLRQFESHSKKTIKQLSYQEVNPYNFKHLLDTSFHYPKESQNVFFIKIVCCQNYTWQGAIQWINHDEKQFFRSALELLEIIYYSL